MNAHKKEELISNYIESRLTKLEITQENVNETLKRLERKIESLETNTHQSFNNLTQMIIQSSSSLNNRIWFNFYWMLAGFAGIFAVLAKILKLY